MQAHYSYLYFKNSTTRINIVVEILWRFEKSGSQSKISFIFRNQSSSSPPRTEEPFSGLDISTTPETNNETINHDSDIETAVEADECLTFEPGIDDSETLTSQIDAEVVQEPPQATPWAYLQGHWWTIGLPLCFLLFFQLLPLPAWVVGFITGILVAVPSAVYVTYTLIDDNAPSTPFVENVHRKKAARPAIIVQEELKRLYVSVSNQFTCPLFFS